jgi:hypothetical protein
MSVIGTRAPDEEDSHTEVGVDAFNGRQSGRRVAAKPFIAYRVPLISTHSSGPSNTRSQPTVTVLAAHGHVPEKVDRLSLSPPPPHPTTVTAATTIIVSKRRALVVRWLLIVPL